jgi:hypothetical protein
LDAFPQTYNQVFIELPKLKYWKGTHPAWPILHTLTLKTLPDAEKHADAYPETREIINRQIQISSDKKMWEEFRMYEKSKRDIRAAQAEVRDKLVEKGMKKGEKNLIQKLKNNGMPLEQIVKYSGYPMATVLKYCAN